MTPLRELSSLEEVAELATDGAELFVRWSKGPEDDAVEKSVDFASGLELPGLSVNPLTPPAWWTLPVELWVARQIRAYAHLSEKEPDRFAWILHGHICDRGPDNEPLVEDIEPVGRLAKDVLVGAERREPESSREADNVAPWRSSNIR